MLFLMVILLKSLHETASWLSSTTWKILQIVQ